jgi:transaldolase/glucose-6-phosphate isomerase
VSPSIARDTSATLGEAKRFWKAVDRPNVFIKIPANPEGIPAIRQATAAGISVNITLIFSVRVYEQVIDAYLSGLEDRVAQGLPISQIHSVASFFVSRVDTAVDKLLEEKGAKEPKAGSLPPMPSRPTAPRPPSTPCAAALAKGATRQRPLASTDQEQGLQPTDVRRALIGRHRQHHALQRCGAFNDHGRSRADDPGNVEDARAQVALVQGLGIDLKAVCRRLTDEGLDLFSKALDGLLHAISARAAAQGFARKAQLRENLGSRKDEAAEGLKK